MLPNENIFHDRHVVKKAYILKGTCNTALHHLVWAQTYYRPAIKANITRTWMIDASNQVKDGRFPGAIRANNANDLPWPDLKIHVLYCRKTTKVFGDRL